jgi:hypothetical protein
MDLEALYEEFKTERAEFCRLKKRFEELPENYEKLEEESWRLTYILLDITKICNAWLDITKICNAWMDSCLPKSEERSV